MSLKYAELLSQARTNYNTNRPQNLVATRRFIDEDNGSNLGGIMGRRNTVSADEGAEDFMTAAFNKVVASNQTLAEQMADLTEGSSTNAMTDPDGKPLDILNKGDDVSIKIDPKSKEGVDNFLSSLAMRESSKNSKAIRTNKDDRQFGGTWQIGRAVQIQHMNATGAEYTMDDFIDDPILQNDVAIFHIGKLDEAISRLKNIPEKFNDINGLRGVGHLGGAKGMKKFVESGGKYNPTDELGTSLMDYFNKFSSKG